MGPGLCRPEAFDLVVERFPDDTALFPPPGAGDPIAFIFDRAFDLVARTGRSLRLASPEGRRSLREGAAAFYRLDNVELLMRLRDFIDESLPWTFEEENEACLGFLRGGFRERVRGQKEACWEGLQRGIATGMPGCAAARACRGNGSEGGLPSEQACDTYQAGWRASALALADAAPASAAELAARVRAACPALRVLADEARGEALVAARVAAGLGATREQRSVRGLAVRLLTGVLDELLGELSRRLDLPPARTYRLSS